MDKTRSPLTFPWVHFTTASSLFGSDAHILLGIGGKFTYIVYSRCNFSDALPGFRAAAVPL